MTLKEEMNMQFNKKISKSGAVTLPAALRREFGIDQGEKFNIGVDAEGSITLKRTQGSCIFCKSENDLITHSSRFVCKSCVESINQKASV